MLRKSSQLNAALPRYISDGFPKETYHYFQFPTNENEKANFVHYPFWQNLLRKVAGFCLFPYTMFKTTLINKDEVGLMLNGNGEPELLGPGWHTLFHPMSRLIKVQNQTDPYIAFSSLKMINVKSGEVCYCTDSKTGKQILLTEGRHFLTSPSIVYRGFINLNTPEDLYDPATGGKTLINDNDLRIIRIETAEQGIISRRGEYQILNTGLHVIAPPDKYMGKIKTSQETMKLGVLEVNSKDLVKLKIDADVFYRIKDPLKAITTIGKDFAKFIQEKAKAVLNTIIRSQSYMHAGQAHTEKANSRAEGNETGSAEHASVVTLRPVQNVLDAKETPVVNFTNFAPDMTAKSIHDQFIRNIQDDLKENGIEISDIRIESMEIADAQLARDLANQASTSAKTQTEVFNLHAQAQIQQQRAANEGRVKGIQAEANAAAIETEAKARAFATKQEADAKAYATEAEAIAKKKAQVLEGEGMRAFGENLANSPVAQQIAIINAQVMPLSKASKIELSQFPVGMGSLFGPMSPAFFAAQGNAALLRSDRKEDKLVSSPRRHSAIAGN